jgi:serine phosphatase RsbU (regulator of sigma subunit)
VKAGSSNSYGGGSGELPLEYLKEALIQLQPTGNDEQSLRFYILWAFNDRYGHKEVSEIPAEEWEFHMDNIQHLLQMNIDTLVRAELYREMGDFEQAIQILNSLEVADNMKSIHSQLLQQAQQHNRKVFVIYGEIQRNALTLDKYREETYTPSKYDEEDSCHLPF